MKRPAIKSWYRIRAARKTAEILIYEEIGAWGITAKQFADELSALGDLESLSVRINSPGGDVFDAMAIHNALQRQTGKVVVHIDGLCASAATVVAMAGDETRMAENGQYMIHEPWSFAGGSSDDMQRSADLLDSVAGQIVDMYARKTGMDAESIREMMRNETWMTAQQALEFGFVDAIDENLRIAAKAHDLSRFKHAPTEPTMSETKESADIPVSDSPPAAPPVEIPSNEDDRPLEPVAIARLCATAQEHGLTPVLLASPHTEAQVSARLAQARAIRQICAVAKLPERAAGLIASGHDENSAKLALWDALVARDQSTPAIDSARPDPIPAGLPVDQRCEAEWNRSPELRAEFGTLAVYQSFARAEESGRIKLYGGKP